MLRLQNSTFPNPDCAFYVPEMDGHKYLCHETARMRDPLGLKKCERKYCPRVKNIPEVWTTDGTGPR